MVSAHLAVGNLFLVIPAGAGTRRYAPREQKLVAMTSLKLHPTSSWLTGHLGLNTEA